jgi:hypothetical protein
MMSKWELQHLAVANNGESIVFLRISRENVVGQNGWRVEVISYMPHQAFRLNGRFRRPKLIVSQSHGSKTPIFTAIMDLPWR